MATMKMRARRLTQDEIDARISLFMVRAERAEDRRDRCKWEGEAYWHWHDVAAKWHERARRLMPKGS